MLCRVNLELRNLEGLQQLGPHRLRILQRLESRRERRKLIVAKVALLHAGSQDEVIIG
jgi:hypothetical protein